MPLSDESRERAAAHLRRLAEGRRKVDPARVLELHAAGLTVGEVAAALGCCADRVKVYRKRLGLAHTPRNFSPAGLEALRASAAAVLRGTHAVGVARRKAREAALAARYGLPPDLYPCQVVVLLALAGGPLTAAALIPLAGRRPPRNGSDAVGAFTAPRAAGGNYLRDLVRRGLVASTGRRAVGRRGSEPGVYLLTQHAMDLMSKGATA